MKVLFVTSFKDSAITNSTQVTPYDGLCGLTPKLLSTGSELLVTKMFDQGKIPKNMFSTFYDSVNGSSYLFFGDYETSKLTGNVTWFPIKDSGYWDLYTTNIEYNGEGMGNFAENKSCTVDSGTSLAYFPKDMVESIMSSVGGCKRDASGSVACKCKGLDSIKPLWVNFRDGAIETQPQYWVHYKSDEGLCYLLINYLSSGDCLLGDSFMRGKYIVHDVTNKKMAFGNVRATKAHSESATKYLGFLGLLAIIAICLIPIFCVCCTGVCFCCVAFWSCACFFILPP